MKSIYLLVLILLMSDTIKSQSYSGPESVEFDLINNRYIVSNASSGNLQKVVPGNPPSLFTAAVSSPHGLAIIDTVIYVADGASIVGFGLTGATPVFNLNLGATYLNGLCSDGNMFLYATDFSAKKIYKINVLNNTFNVFVPNTSLTPNGILFDAANNRLVYATWGSGAQIKDVKLSDSTSTTLLTTSLSNIDGIVQDGLGRFYVSAYSANAVYRIDSALTGPPVMVVSGLSHPADIYYNLLSDTLAVPNAQGNTVTFHNMASFTGIEDYEIDNLNFSVSTQNNKLLLKWNQFKNQPVEIQILDVAGSLFYQNKTVDTTIGLMKLEIDMNTFSNGIYIAVLTFGNEIVSQRFLK